MKLNENALNGSFSNVPEGFDKAMTRAFAQIHRECAAQQPPRRYARRLSFGTVLLIVLLLAAIAVGATLLSHNVFEVTMGDTPQNAASLTKHDLVKVSFEHCDIEVKEAAYDGMSLYIVYSIRDRTAVEPLGELGEDGMYYLTEERSPGMELDDIGWWMDNLWIDGQSVNMPGMSGGATVGSEVPGELLFYMTYRLDQEDLYLNGQNVEIALPVGKRQPYESLVADPETGAIEKPGDGLVTFHLDCAIRDGVTTEHPNIEKDLPICVAAVSQVVYTPIRLYLTLDHQVKQEAMDAYIALNGDGYRDEKGNLLWPYSGLDVLEGWSMSLTLVDQDGKPVFETMEGFYGCQGAGELQTWYTFPYCESYPEEMYLAPIPAPGKAADLTLGVRVR